MKVVCISQFSDFVGGGEYSIFDLMTHLPADVEPVLLVPAEGELSARAKSEGIAWDLAPMPRIGIASLAALWAWRTLLADIKPDLLHANNSRPAFYAGITGRLLGIPAIFHCRIAQRDGLMDAILVRLVRAIVCNSRAVASRFSRFRLPVQVVYNGIQVPESGKESCRTGSRLLFAGRLSEEKQPHVAVDVFEALAGEFPGLQLDVIGQSGPDPAYAQLLQARIASSPFHERIHCHGQVKNPSVFYRVADILTVPSLHEGFGRVLVEAMATGLPVVAFKTGGIPEVLEDGKQGFLIPPGEHSKMVSAVRRLLEDADLRLKMGETGYARARVFSLGKHIEKICQLYGQLLKGE